MENFWKVCTPDFRLEGAWNLQLAVEESAAAFSPGCLVSPNRSAGRAARSLAASTAWATRSRRAPSCS